MATSNTIWTVVGGKDRGGILVRGEQGLAAPPLGERLSFGALVRIRAQKGIRVHYELIEGTGPRSGWISTQVGKASERATMLEPLEWPRSRRDSDEDSASDPTAAFYGSDVSTQDSPRPSGESMKSQKVSASMAIDWCTKVCHSLDDGADPNVQDSAGNTPLDHAIKNKIVALVRNLLLHGADPLKKTPNGWTAADIVKSQQIKSYLQFFGPLLRSAAPCTERMIERLCKIAVPSWRKLPQGVVLRIESFDRGTHQYIRKVQLHGPRSDHILPSSCVYAFTPSTNVDMQRANSLIVRRLAKEGVAPKIYAALGGHRLMEYCEGRLLFGGPEQSHYVNKHFTSGRSDQNAGDVTVMESLGKSIGKLHALSLDCFAQAMEAEEFQRQVNSPSFFPPVVHRTGGLTDIVSRAIKSPALPRQGLFAHPVCCHGNLHGGNIIHGDGHQMRIIDWESPCIGHRGMDLSYLFLCAPGATLESRRAFAAAYLATCAPVPPESADVDQFLFDVECCMPLGLITMVALAQRYAPFSADDILDQANCTLDALNKLEAMNPGRKRSLKKMGLLRLLMGDESP